jgi:hypothetical protein
MVVIKFLGVLWDRFLCCYYPVDFYIALVYRFRRSLPLQLRPLTA